MGNKVDLKTEKWYRKRMAKMPPTQTKLQHVAERGASYANQKLLRHRKTGQAKITVTRGKVDRFVNLVHPWAAAIEYGHWVEGKYGPSKPGDEIRAEGIYVIRHAFLRMQGGS